MELTKLEKEILQEIDDLTDGFGEETNYILDYLKSKGYDMKVTRGVIGSLVKKEELVHQGDAIYMGYTVK